MPEAGTLYVCATPIGNLGDITLRVLDTLKTVDLIAAEDTRHSRKLLEHYGIKTPLISCHEHNERQRAGELIERLKQGQNIALISDAGMPGISDPGRIIINHCREEGIPVDVLPGPNAAITALVLSGMAEDRFTFLGFLPAAKGERKKFLESVSRLEYTMIFYEAPHRLLGTLRTMQEVLGDREASVVRELTKIHQTVHRGKISELITWFEKSPPLGECCIIAAPYTREAERGDPSLWLKDLRELEAGGLESKEAMKMVAQKYGISKRDVYRAKINAKT